MGDGGWLDWMRRGRDVGGALGVNRRTLLGAGIGAAAAAAPAALAGTLLVGRSSALPRGVSVGGVDVGGLTADEALGRLQARWGAFLAGPAEFQLGGRSWRPAAQDIGVRADFQASLRAVVVAQPAGGLLDLLTGEASAPPAAPPVIAYDRGTARRFLEALGAGFDQPATDAGLRMRGDGRLELSPGQPGRVVDVEQALRDLEAGLSRAAPGHVVHLRFREDRPAVSTEAAEAAAAAARRVVGQPIWLMRGNRGWVIEPEHLRNALVIDASGRGIAVEIEFTRFNDLFHTIEDTLTAEPVEGVFEMNERQDRVTAFKPGNPGQRLDRAQLERRILAAAQREDQRRVDVPLVILNKEYDTAANPMGIRDLLATGSSVYKGSADYRDHNIANGARKLDGAIVRPGETFSFNERVGAFTLAQGWVAGSVIVEDRTEQGIGGGICQVSTTLFRAAMAAGLPIEERWPHLYRVRYYEMGKFPIGYDATIFSPGPDLKFTNNYQHPIMLRARLDRRLSTLDFEIWGVSDGREVTLSEPRLWDWVEPPPDEAVVDSEEDPDYEKQIEFAKDGVNAEIRRTIARADGTQTSSTFRSTYTAWPNRYIVGIDQAKERFPTSFNTWVDKNPDEAARWGVTRVPGAPSDPSAPSG